jgi:protein phosphatase
MYVYAGKSDIGYGREVNEDYISAVNLSEDTLFAIVTDGAGSLSGSLQPAAITTIEITETIRRLYENEKEIFLSNPKLFITEAIHTANRVLGAFKLGNEEKYSGFGACVTCCLLYKSNEHTHLCFAHAGNTRLYLIRQNTQDGAAIIRQLTRDHTRAYPLFEDNTLTLEQYHTHPDRLVCTSGLGILSEPEIQVFEGRLKPNDILLLTTDGIHFSIRSEGILGIIAASGNCGAAVDGLITAAAMQRYIDNASALMIYIP